MQTQDARNVAARILLFEDKAHDRRGHFPHWFAQIARELSSAGNEVHVLTSLGWALEEEGHSLGAVVMHAMPRRFRATRFIGERGHALVGRLLQFLRLEKALSKPLRLTASFVQQWALVAAVRQTVRQLGRDEDTLVLVLSMALQLEWACVLAPRRGRWIVHEYFKPAEPISYNGLVRRMGSRLAARREMQRRTVGGHVRLVANNAPAGEAWLSLYPWLDCEAVPAAVCLPIEAMPKARARRELGVHPSLTLALHFGFGHEWKDLATVFSAFAKEKGLGHLFVAGVGSKDQFARWRQTHSDVNPPELTVADGYVTEAKKHLLYSAADYVVLSFLSNTTNDSGTLSDAVAYGLPVCCSDTGGAGSVVRDYGLGVLFIPGDPVSLAVAAQRAAQFVVDPKDRDRYLQAHSPSALARRLVGKSSPLAPPSSVLDELSE